MKVPGNLSESLTKGWMIESGRAVQRSVPALLLWQEDFTIEASKQFLAIVKAAHSGQFRTVEFGDRMSFALNSRLLYRGWAFLPPQK